MDYAKKMEKVVVTILIVKAKIVSTASMAIANRNTVEIAIMDIVIFVIRKKLNLDPPEKGAPILNF